MVDLDAVAQHGSNQSVALAALCVATTFAGGASAPTRFDLWHLSVTSCRRY